MLTNENYPIWKTALFILLFLVLLIVMGNLLYSKAQNSSNSSVNSTKLISDQQNILNQQDAINTNWLRTLNPLVKKVEGRIAWSNILQKGMMEFVALPKIAENQKYQLWIYDLEGENTKPILSSEFSEINTDKTLIPIKSKTLIRSPFKFELVLKTEDVDASQALLLAQP